MSKTSKMCISNSNFRWRQRPELSSTGCRTSPLFSVRTSTVESWWSPIRMTWRGTGRLASTRPLLMRASSAGWPQRTPAPIRSILLLLLSLPVLIFKITTAFQIAYFFFKLPLERMYYYTQYAYCFPCRSVNGTYVPLRIVGQNSQIAYCFLGHTKSVSGILNSMVVWVSERSQGHQEDDWMRDWVAPLCTQHVPVSYLTRWCPTQTGGPATTRTSSDTTTSSMEPTGTTYQEVRMCVFFKVNLA